MSERLDRLRSLLRAGASRASGALGELPPIGALRDVVREIRARRARIPERQLARAVLRAGTIAAASVRTRGGRIEIDAELASGRTIRAVLVPQAPRFAPQGAKEIVFSVDPPEAAADPALRDVAGTLASQIARALWAPFLGALPPGGVDPPALVDREEDRLRIDLRTCPAVRAATQAGGLRARMIDLLRIERFEVDEHGLALRLALPELSGAP